MTLQSGNHVSGQPRGTTSRLTHLDAAKGLAILAVILGHSGISQINSLVYSFHLPLFFIISGYFCNHKTDTISFAKRRFIQLIIPYIIVSGLVIILHTLDSYCTSGYYPARTALKNISIAALYGTGNPTSVLGYDITAIGAIWFLPATFVAQLIWRYTSTWKYPFLWAAVIALIGYYSGKLLWLPMSIQAGMTCCIFIYLGWYARECCIQRFTTHKLLPFILSICFVIWVINIIWFPHFYLVRNHMQGGLLNIIGGTCGSILIITLCQSLQRYTKILFSFLKWCGLNSLIILCCHNIDAMCCHAYDICKIMNIEHTNMLIAIRLCIGALTLAICYILLRNSVQFLKRKLMFLLAKP